MCIRDRVLSVCTNCCTNKSGKIFSPTPSSKYGCACLSGSWSTPCEDESVTNQKIVAGGPCICRTYQTQPDGSNKCIEWSPPGCGDDSFSVTTDTEVVTTSTSFNTCEDKIDSGFNETLSHLSISNHLDIIRNTSGGHTKNWSTYKFKHYPNSTPTNHSDLCLAGEDKEFIKKFMTKSGQSIFNPALAKDIFSKEDFIK